MSLWTVEWEGGLVVGGDDNRRLTPNFRLKEFKRPDGRIKVHRELISAIQMLRDGFGKTLAVVSTDDDGLGVFITGTPMNELLLAADRIKAHHLFTTVEEKEGKVHLVIPNPDRLPEIELEQALETAFSVTSTFETSGDKFQQVTGNFDGAGISFGPAQSNFKSGTLTPLFKKFQKESESTLRSCFVEPEDYEEFLKVLGLSVQEQIQWANSISTGTGLHDIVEPWKGYFRAVGRVPSFRRIMVETILRDYGAKLLREVKYLQRLCPAIKIDHLRCVCALYDLVIQQGSLDRAHAAIEVRVQRENPKDQFELVKVAVEERGNAANPAWRADCVSRRVGILKGVPETVEGKQRANISFYLLRDVRIRGASEYAEADFTEPLTRASQAIASGSSLLA